MHKMGKRKPFPRTEALAPGKQRRRGTSARMLASALSARTKGNGTLAGTSWSGAETDAVCLLTFSQNEFTLWEEVTQEYITRDNGKTLTLTVVTASITMIQK